MVKLSNLRNIDPKDDTQINDKSKVSNQEMLDIIKKFKSFVGDEEVTKAHKFFMPNLQEQAAMLEWAGISFGEDFTLLLQKSMKKLACQSGASQMQFFGKIFGTEKDYWVVCGKLPYVEEEPSNPN
jgi:radial spoke head protein 4A|tara:strand:- start:761 stop:1138 length:378 start_codon:yes stop_codon:yes gene_type:complete